jgi:hypothetical protein
MEKKLIYRKVSKWLVETYEWWVYTKKIFEKAEGNLKRVIYVDTHTQKHL